MFSTTTDVLDGVAKGRGSHRAFTRRRDLRLPSSRDTESLVVYQAYESSVVRTWLPGRWLALRVLRGVDVPYLHVLATDAVQSLGDFLDEV